MTGVIPVVLAITALLVLVSVLLPLADRFNLPHVVLIAGLGMVLGLGSLWVDDIALHGIVGDAVRGLNSLRLPSEAFLFLFLPILLFTVGLTSEVRRLFDDFAAVLLLAVVAVVVSTVFVGLSLSLIGQAGLVVCLLVGSIIATTDPAAVVATFRDLGAPRRLSILVEGESLFNDAAAIALFALLLDVLMGTREPSVIDGTLAFLKGFLGGIAVGYLMGRLVSAILPSLREALVAEITVSVALAYFSFIVGEHYLHVSGIVAVVTAALTFAVYAPTRMTPDNWNTLVETWKQLEFWANSLIFVLAAVLAARVLSDVTLVDLGLLGVLIVAAYAARAFTLYVLLPGLTAVKVTEPVAGAHRAVILWGGLRGAVTMVLALAASDHPSLTDDQQHFVGVLALGFVIFTLFVGAPTLRPLLHLLGLDKLSATEAALRDRVMALSRGEIRDQLDVVARDYGLAPKPVDPATQSSARESEIVPLIPGDRIAVGLLTLATRERDLYYLHFRDRTISRHMARVLMSASEHVFDLVKTGGVEGYHRAGSEMVRLSRPLRLGLWIHRHTGWSEPLSAALADRFEALLVMQLVLRGLVKFNNDSIAALLGAETCETLQTLLAERAESVDTALAAIELQYPRYTSALREHHLKRAEIRFQSDSYRRKLEDTLISREVYGDLQRVLRKRRQEIERRPPLDLGLKLAEMVGRVPMFANLDSDRLAHVIRRLRPRLAVPGERIIEKGERGDEMYFIASGEVDVITPSGPIALATGAFFGEMALLTRQPRNADVVASGYVQLLVLEGGDFRTLMRSDETIRVEIERVVAERSGDNAQRRAE